MSRNGPKSTPRSNFKKNFLKYAKDTISNLLPIFKYRNIPQGVGIRLGNHFFSNWRHKYSILKINFSIFFPVKSQSAEKGFQLAKLLFRKLKSAMKARGYPLTN